MAERIQPENETLAFAENLFLFLMKKHNPDNVPRSIPKQSEYFNLNVGKSASLMYQLTKDDTKLVCRKNFPYGKKMDEFCDWIHDTFLEKHFNPNVFTNLFFLAAFVFEVALFAFSKGEAKHYLCVADLWCYLFDRAFAGEFFAKGGWEGLDVEAKTIAFIYDCLLIRFPDGKIDVSRICENMEGLMSGQISVSEATIMGIETGGACGFSETGGSYEQKGNVTSRSPKKASKKDKRRAKEMPSPALESGIVIMIETPPELVREGFPLLVHPEGQKYYAGLIQQYEKGNMSKRDVVREFHDYNRVPVMASELHTMDMRELPGQRYDPLDELYSGEVTFSKTKSKSPRKSKPESSVCELTSGIEQLQVSSKSPLKVKATKDKTASVASTEEPEVPEDENSDSGPEESGEEGEKQPSPSKKRGGKKKKGKGGKKRKKK